MRLIDADALGELVSHGVVHYEDIMAQPTVDAVPVRHGKWVPKYIRIGGQDLVSGMKCSECGEDALDAEGDEFLTDYCPNCGARMDAE